MERRSRLIGAGRVEEPLLAERWRDHLRADRQPRPVKAAGHDHARQTRHIDGNGVDIAQIHLNRVVRVRAQRVRRRRRGRGQQDIRLFKAGVKPALDERLNAQGLIIVRIVIARGERERAQHDAPLDLRAEALAPRRQIQVVQILEMCRAEAVFHAVEAFQVGACLRAGNDIIGRDHIFHCLYGEKFYDRTL